MNWITVLGFSLTGIGSFLTYYGTTIDSAKDKQDIIDSQKKTEDNILDSVTETGRPELRINGFSFGKNRTTDPKYSKYKHQFTYKVINHGGRSANQLKANSFFFEKIDNETIGRYNLIGFDEKYIVQNDIAPSETKPYTYPFTVSETEGLEQLNNTLIKFQLDYTDSKTGESGQYVLYQQFHVDSNGVQLSMLTQPDIDLIENFIKIKSK